MSGELEWIDHLDSRYTEFQKLLQQAKQSPENISTDDQANTTQTIMVNRNIIRETEKTRNLREVNIDRIIIQETPQEQRQSKTTLRRIENDITRNTKKSVTNCKINGDWRENVKENTFRVGKLDVTKIEQRSKEFQIMEEKNRMYKKKKVLSFSSKLIPTFSCH